jgi:lipopolysaccharide transport system permease protein
VLFPQQVLPAVKLTANFVNFLLSLPILVIFMLANGVPVTYHLIAFPLVAAVHILFCFGLVLMLAAANVFMRDTRHILGNLLTLWFFLTPILYPVTQVPEKYRFLIYLNPEAILTMAYHDIFFWGVWPRWELLGGILVLGMVMLFAGVTVFESHKEYFAEKI